MLDPKPIEHYMTRLLFPVLETIYHGKDFKPATKCRQIIEGQRKTS